MSLVSGERPLFCCSNPGEIVPIPNPYENWRVDEERYLVVALCRSCQRPAVLQNTTTNELHFPFSSNTYDPTTDKNIQLLRNSHPTQRLDDDQFRSRFNSPNSPD